MANGSTPHVGVLPLRYLVVGDSRCLRSMDNRPLGSVPLRSASSARGSLICRVDENASAVLTDDDLLVHLDLHLALSGDAVEATCLSLPALLRKSSPPAPVVARTSSTTASIRQATLSPMVTRSRLAVTTSTCRCAVVVGVSAASRVPVETPSSLRANNHQ